MKQTDQAGPTNLSGALNENVSHRHRCRNACSSLEDDVCTGLGSAVLEEKNISLEVCIEVPWLYPIPVCFQCFLLSF